VNAALRLERILQCHFVYLDLNKWIDLARAASGHKDGKHYHAALKTAEQLVLAKRAIFPLSFAHFMEVAKIGDDTRRRNVARLMVKLSQGWFLESARSLLAAELRKAIALRFDKLFDVEKIVPLTRSVKSAFGVAGRLGVKEFDDTILDSPGALEECLSGARATRHFVERWKTFANSHERGRSLRRAASRDVRKRAYCASVTMAIQDDLVLALSECGLTWKQFGDLGPKGCVELLESVPSLEVEIKLFVERNEHWDRKIAPNDEIDLGFLSLAIPYCQMVITEKFWVSLVHRTRLDAKYGTQVGHDLNKMILGLLTQLK
jgi:hypothetical protein